MEYKCNVCSKLYKSYQSLWNHTKKHTNTNIDQAVTFIQPKNIKINFTKITAVFF